jgi:phosphoenolpyruvate---glycerone phosphotransferase subunit DhaL
MNQFANQDGFPVLEAMVAVIAENVKYLSEVDGAIGDGDHGINMNKGFQMFHSAAQGRTLSLSEGLQLLGDTLLGDIGGSMGPLYGGFFRGMAKVSARAQTIDTKLFLAMLCEGRDAIFLIGDAKVGDKTLLDALVPGIEAFQNAGDDFRAALASMETAASRGAQDTRDMVAKVGRSARLGERSRGVLDAGAASCHLLLKSMKERISLLLS